MKNEFSKLNWDSDFFGFNVGKITGDIDDRSDLKRIENLMDENNCVLSYFSVSDVLPDLFSKSDSIEFTLVDQKITYVKAINSELEIAKSIGEVEREISENKLIDLAIQSGIYSRFNVDRKIPTEKFEEMYCLWLRNSVYGDLANAVLTSKLDNELTGFVTIGDRNGRADIGLIAVDTDFRGRGIGKSLMCGAEKWSDNIGYESIQVVTQGDNKAAKNLYESCGYEIESSEMVYHIWKK